MEKMLVVVFDNEKQAYEGSRALYQLDMEGTVSIHGESVISKKADGTLTVHEADGDFPIRTISGTALGSLIGLLGGPVGFGIGAAAGAFAGFLGDLRTAGVDGDFLDDVSKALQPGKSAVVADLSEEWVTPVDAQMEELQGVVFRTTRSAVEQEQIAREEANLRAEMAQLKAEHAQAKAERKQRLQSMVERLNTKLQAKLQKQQQQREELKREMDAKLHAIQERAAKVKGDAKAALESRIADLRRDYEVGKAKLTGSAAVGSRQ